MSGIRFVDLTEETLDLIPRHFFPEGGAMSDCTRCLYWERPDLFGQVEGDPAAAVKRDWFLDVLSERKACGKLALRGQRVVAWARYAPPSKLPGLSAYVGRRPSPDALFLACFSVSPSERGRGTGARFLREIQTDLASQGLPAMETYARRSSANNPAGPLKLYVSAGFKVIGGDDEFPLLRCELAALVVDGQAKVPARPASAGLPVRPLKSESGRHGRRTSSSGRHRGQSRRAPAAS